MKKSIRLGVVLALMMVLCGISQAYAAISQEQLDTVDAYIQQMMDQYKIPGLSAVIVAGDQVAYAKGFGYADAEGTQPVDVNTVFQIASDSKNMTALAIMQLKDQGKLAVDDPVIQYIPWFASKDKENSDRITIKNLLQHTSGIPTRAYGLQIKDSTPDQLEEQVRRLSESNLTVQPGARFQYSNMNYWILSLIVETVSGMKFADYMEQNIFGPLGMERTGYADKLAHAGNVAIGHRVENGKHVPFDYSVPGTTIAAGGVYTCAADMGHYLSLLLNGGTYNDMTILSPESMDEMVSNGTKLNAAQEYGYGFYILHGEDNFRLIFHGGDNPNFTANIYWAPDDDLAFMIMANTQHTATHGIATNVSRILLGGQAQPFQTVTVQDQNLAGLLNKIKLGLIAVMVIWALIVLIGLLTGRYVIFKGRRSLARFVLQVIIFPLVIFAGALICYLLPIMQIGSLDVALLYQPDMVQGILGIAATLVGFGLVCILFGFVSKVKPAVKQVQKAL